jgi:2-alkenal reductase
VGQGSGFVIDPQGYIVTNWHVVVEADEIRVGFADGRVFDAEVVGLDQFSDIAVLKINPPADYPLTAVELGDSSTVRVGQRVIAIGNPFGLSGTMTVGIVSAVGRTIPTVRVDGTGVFSNPLIIQTDAAINPGNSGGPLLDSHGRVIGVNYAIRTETGTNTGIGFAVPVNTVRLVAPQLIASGEVAYPYLGISSQTAFSMYELAEEYDLPVYEGVLVGVVTEGGPADQAGIRGGTDEETYRSVSITLGGDIITAIDGVPLHNFDELLGYLVNNTTVGQTVILTIVREGQTMEVPVTLGERPSDYGVRQFPSPRMRELSRSAFIRGAGRELTKNLWH